MSIHVNNIRLAQPIMSSVRQRTEVSKSRGLSASVSFVSLPHLPLSCFGSRPIPRAGKTPKIPLLGPPVLPNPTETLVGGYIGPTCIYPRLHCTYHAIYKMVDTLWKSERTKQKYLINWILNGKAKYVHENMFRLDFKIPDHFIYMSLNRNSDYPYIPGYEHNDICKWSDPVFWNCCEMWRAC